MPVTVPDTTMRYARYAAIAWMAVIFALSSMPGDAVPAGDYGSYGHFFLYAVLGGLYVLALPADRPAMRAVLLAVVLASAYGITDELHQAFVPGRVPDPVDWLVDTAGALTGAGTALLVSRRARRSG